MAEEKDMKEKAVYEAVTAEIKKMGEDTRAIFDEQKRQIEDLKHTLDVAPSKTDALVTSKVAKLQEDIVTRQEAMDASSAKSQARMDALEATIKRSGWEGGGTQPDKKLMEEARAFKTTCLSRRGTLPSTGITDEQVNVDEYAAYKKLFPWYLRRDDRTFTQEQVKTLSVGSDPDGGFTVTPEMLDRIVQRMWEVDVIEQLCTVQTISTDSLEMWVDRDHADDGWATETMANAVTVTPQLGKRYISVFIQEARPRATQQLLDDSAWDMEAWLTRKVAERMGRTRGAAFVTGTGVGQPRGILTYGASGTAWGQIEWQNLGAAAVPTTDGLLRLKFLLMEEYMANATWLMNRQTVMETMLLKDGDSRYIWREGLSEGAPSILLGNPVRMCTSMPVVAVNSLSYAFGDWRQAYMVVQRQGITVQRDPYTAKPLVEFYTRARVGGDVMDFSALKLGYIHV